MTGVRITVSTCKKLKVYNRCIILSSNIHSFQKQNYLLAEPDEFKSPRDINVHMYASCENISCLINCANKCTKFVNRMLFSGLLSKIFYFVLFVTKHKSVWKNEIYPTYLGQVHTDLNISSKLVGKWEMELELMKLNPYHLKCHFHSEGY